MIIGKGNNKISTDYWNSSELNYIGIGGFKRWYIGYRNISEFAYWYTSLSIILFDLVSQVFYYGYQLTISKYLLFTDSLIPSVPQPAWKFPCSLSFTLTHLVSGSGELGMFQYFLIQWSVLLLTVYWEMWLSIYCIYPNKSRAYITWAQINTEVQCSKVNKHLCKMQKGLI